MLAPNQRRPAHRRALRIGWTLRGEMRRQQHQQRGGGQDDAWRSHDQNCAAGP
jgi:hypothetical protein